MMIMSHCGISVVINVRLYDSQKELKMGAHKKTCLEFYIINLYTPSDCNCIAHRTEMLAIMKVYERRQ